MFQDMEWDEMTRPGQTTTAAPEEDREIESDRQIGVELADLSDRPAGQPSPRRGALDPCADAKRRDSEEGEEEEFEEDIAEDETLEEEDEEEEDFDEDFAEDDLDNDFDDDDAEEEEEEL